MSARSSMQREPLSPRTESDINSQKTNPRKRKLDQAREPKHDILLEPFQATASQSFCLILCPANYDRVQTDDNPQYQYSFTPICLLDRSQLRLSDIDYVKSESVPSSGCRLNAHIPIVGPSSASKPSLLLARLADHATLCVIESITPDTHLYCALRSDVAEERFTVIEPIHLNVERDLSLTASKNTASERPASRAENCSQDIRNGRAPSPKRPKNRRGTAARLSIFAEKGAATAVCQTLELNDSQVPLSVGLVDSSDALELLEPTQLSQITPIIPNEEDVIVPPAPIREPLEVVHEALMKALYNSQAALAHFTKSTLARTRAAFRASADTNLVDLADFYRSRLTTSKKMDLKYKETTPKILENMNLRTLSGDAAISPSAKRTKKSPSYPKKVGKNGLYFDEESYLQSSWLNRDQKKEALQTESMLQVVQDFVKELRNRETQLHIILIMEILALERTPDVNEKAPDPRVKQEPVDEELGSASVVVASPVKKKKDLKPTLDILVDRLCIYQSVGFADSSTKDRAGTAIEVTDKLRDFCCNVILPFYLHKVPDVVKEVSAKLGGPDILSKKEAAAKSKAGPSVRAAPGKAPMQRSKSQKTLERVLKEDRGSRRASLSRSNSTLGIMSVRNCVDPSRPKSRGNLQRAQSFTHREVDLVAQIKTEEAKRKKFNDLAKRKEDLDAAINALKKPNRGLAGKEIMADSEKRKLGLGPGGRRGVPLLRSESDPCLGVQITATPKKGVRPNTTAGGDFFLHPPRSGFDTQTVDSPEELVIPSSAVRGGIVRTLDGSKSTSAIISETPSRGSAKTTDFFHLQVPSHSPDLTSSPLAKRLPPPSMISSITATPPPKRAFKHTSIHPTETIQATPLPRMNLSRKPILLTSVQKTGADSDMERVFRSAPLVSENVVKSMDRVMAGQKTREKEASIYDALGWDDDEDELL